MDKEVMKTTVELTYGLLTAHPRELRIALAYYILTADGARQAELPLREKPPAPTITAPRPHDYPPRSRTIIDRENIPIYQGVDYEQHRCWQHEGRDRELYRRFMAGESEFQLGDAFRMSPHWIRRCISRVHYSEKGDS